MNTNKAIKKQRNKYFRFVFLMSFIFILFPCIVIYRKLYNYIVFIYIVVLDLLILISILKRTEEEWLFYTQKISKFYIKNGIFKRVYSFKCEEARFVHVDGKEENLKLFLIIQSKRKNKTLKVITKKFIKQYPYAGSYYYNLFKRKPDYNYYYVIVDKGKYRKHLLLDKLYSSCFNAFYSEEAVKYIKEYRK
ncbi:hypothetical protein ACOAKC_03120 [Hathewaya histolytica]|uniref:Membrane protein n=1 Tax=Hathewaya histolytica TaxID=1498 RepID=A0A4U9RRG1_HATHI|nr:hypothetical protein [Hathewaya histolytica]VTQ94181.1 membrane protein [Hathewaya histolytica]